MNSAYFKISEHTESLRRSQLAEEFENVFSSRFLFGQLFGLSRRREIEDMFFEAWLMLEEGEYDKTNPFMEELVSFNILIASEVDSPLISRIADRVVAFYRWRRGWCLTLLDISAMSGASNLTATIAAMSKFCPINSFDRMTEENLRIECDDIRPVDVLIYLSRGGRTKIPYRKAMEFLAQKERKRGFFETYLTEELAKFERVA